MNVTEDILYLLAASVSLFVVVDPLGNIPIFLAMTENKTSEERAQAVRRATQTMIVILLAFVLVGEAVLRFFGISLAALEIAGGTILFVVGFQMVEIRRVRSKTSPQEEREGIEKEDISLVPLAIPLLSGPGAITTVLVLTAQGSWWPQSALVVLAVFLVGIATYCILSQSMRLLGLLGHGGINILTRLMGLMLVAIAVQFIINGVKGAVPQIVGS